MQKNIVFITDDNYCQHAAVMLESLLQTNGECQFVFYCLSFSLKLGNKEKLSAICNKGSKIIFIEIKDDLGFLKKLETGADIKQWNPIMYLKCFMHLLLPISVDRLLFLDVDMVINHDIGELYKIDLKENIIAGVEDWKYSYLHKRRIGLDENGNYINSGVMIIDVTKWRDLEEKCRMENFLLANKDIIINDQDALALYFKDKIAYIDQRWNVTSYWFEKKPRILDKYLGQLDDIRRNPYIIHFCEPIKPWFKECRHPYAYLYKKYLRLTPWSNYLYPTCGSHFGKPAWRYLVKQWLNDIGLRNDDWAMVKV